MSNSTFLKLVIHVLHINKLKRSKCQKTQTEYTIDNTSYTQMLLGLSQICSKIHLLSIF